MNPDLEVGWEAEAAYCEAILELFPFRVLPRGRVEAVGL